MERRLARLANAERKRAHMQPYRRKRIEYPRRHSAQMAHDDDLFHGSFPEGLIQGENVGAGIDARDIHEAFMRSREHRANILWPEARNMAVGVHVDQRGIAWVTEVFWA